MRLESTKGLPVPPSVGMTLAWKVQDGWLDRKKGDKEEKIMEGKNKHIGLKQDWYRNLMC